MARLPRSDPRHVLVSAREAEELTGQPAEELLTARDVQALVRVRNGRREEMLRIPTALLLSSQSETDAA